MAMDAVKAVFAGVCAGLACTDCLPLHQGRCENLHESVVSSAESYTDIASILEAESVPFSWHESPVGRGVARPGHQVTLPEGSVTHLIYRRSLM